MRSLDEFFETLGSAQFWLHDLPNLFRFEGSDSPLASALLIGLAVALLVIAPGYFYTRHVARLKARVLSHRRPELTLVSVREPGFWEMLSIKRVLDDEGKSLHSRWLAWSVGPGCLAVLISLVLLGS